MILYNVCIRDTLSCLYTPSSCCIISQNFMSVNVTVWNISMTSRTWTTPGGSRWNSTNTTKHTSTTTWAPQSPPARTMIRHTSHTRYALTLHLFCLYTSPSSRWPDYGPKWVRLAKNGLNLGLFQIRFQNFLKLASQNEVKSDLKNLEYVPFGSNQTQTNFWTKWAVTEKIFHYSQRIQYECTSGSTLKTYWFLHFIIFLWVL